MRIPRIKGVIRRRLLVNFRASPEVVQSLLPAPFKPKLHGGFSLVGICLIRLEEIRPAGLPRFLGITSENAAHRIAVQWIDDLGDIREGVYIPRRDSGSWLNRMAGGRIFPGEHHAAKFSVVDRLSDIELSMRSTDGVVSVSVVGRDTDTLPRSSCFGSLSEASAFFEGGSLGYSASRDPKKSDGLILRTDGWRVRALDVSSVHSSYFEDAERFPAASIRFDHALVMRDICHEWHGTEDMNHPEEPNSVHSQSRGSVS